MAWPRRYCLVAPFLSELIRAADRSGGIRVAYLPIVDGVPASAVSAFATDRLEMRT